MDVAHLAGETCRSGGYPLDNIIMTSRPPDILWMVDRRYANSPESRAITTHAMLSGQAIRYVDYGEEPLFSRGKTAVPVGSVEYVRWVAEPLLGSPLPEIPDYPEPLRAFCGRRIDRAPLREAPAGSFVKPTLPKQFDAIRNFDPSKPPSGVALDTGCWTSEPVRFHEEYRVYVLDREAIGIAQYDLDSPDRGLLPEDTDRIAKMIAAWEDQPVAWALDVGRADGFEDLLLVETNDGWATGYYPAAMSAGAYAEWLLARWREILSEARRAIEV